MGNPSQWLHGFVQWTSQWAVQVGDPHGECSRAILLNQLMMAERGHGRDSRTMPHMGFRFIGWGYRNLLPFTKQCSSILPIPKNCTCVFRLYLISYIQLTILHWCFVNTTSSHQPLLLSPALQYRQFSLNQKKQSLPCVVSFFFCPLVSIFFYVPLLLIN